MVVLVESNSVARTKSALKSELSSILNTTGLNERSKMQFATITGKWGEGKVERWRGEEGTRRRRGRWSYLPAVSKRTERECGKASVKSSTA